jgi:hypothetical protein
MKQLFTILCIAVLTLSFSRAGVAQVSIGTPQFGTFGGGPLDIVNLGNLNVNFTIQTVHKAGRGTAFTHNDLIYNSSIWTPTGVSGSQTWIPATNFGWTGLSPTGAAWVSYTYSFWTGQCGNFGQQQYSESQYNNYTYHDLTGTSHSFGGQVNVINSPGGGGMPAERDVSESASSTCLRWLHIDSLRSVWNAQ